MSSINACTFSGRIGRDAETRYTAAGKPVSSFSLAVDVGWGDKAHTLWVGCTLWGERWLNLVPHLVKGSAVAVTGEIDLREYEKKDKTTGTSLDLDCRDVAFNGSADGGAKKSGMSAQPTEGFRKKEPAQQQTLPVDDFVEDDIPF